MGLGDRMKDSQVKLHKAVTGYDERGYAFNEDHTVMYGPGFTLETDLSPEELALCEDVEREYDKHPETFTPLEEALKEYDNVNTRAST